MRRIVIIVTLLSIFSLLGKAEVDPNFYIYLCFGQSNMEGRAEAEDMDYHVDPRFQMMAARDFTNPKRTKGEWYTATPPIANPGARIGMADYFGRTMVAALPAEIKVGVINIAIGGISIEGFIPDELDEYIANADISIKEAAKAFDNNPYQRLVDMGKAAQESGVIKGILLHHGESNNGDGKWTEKVKSVYTSLLKDLNLKAEDVPLFAGEVVGTEYNGLCALNNVVINKLPEIIESSYIIHSNGCPPQDDKLHFTANSYRIMGKRYAYEVLREMGLEIKASEKYDFPNNLKGFYELTHLNESDEIILNTGRSTKLSLWGTFADGHAEDLTYETTFASDDFTIDGNIITAYKAKKGTVTAIHTDFFGHTHKAIIDVNAIDRGPNRLLVVDNGEAGENLWDKQCNTTLGIPMKAGKEYIMKATIKSDNSNAVIWPILTKENSDGSNNIQYLNFITPTPFFIEYTWEFQAEHDYENIQFEFGKLADKVYFDDVSCKEKGTDIEMITNGDFENDDLSKWEIIMDSQRFSIEYENPTSGIKTQKMIQELPNSLYFNLKGQQTEMPTKGFYIKNGKLMIIK